MEPQYQRPNQPHEPPQQQHPAPPSNHHQVAPADNKMQPNNGFNIFDNKEISDNLAGNDKNRKIMLQKLVDSGSVPNLQLKVLSSAHLEKDFTLLINPMGIVP
jgi:hypothetical protein